MVAAGPVLYVGYDIVETFGLSARSVSGVIGALVVYSSIIQASGGTFASQLHVGGNT